jgi:hypothetical protein
VLGIAAAAIYPEFTKSGGDEEEIEEMVLYAITEADPAMCTEVFTDRWLEEQFAPDSSQDPIERCQEVNSGTPNKAVTTTVESVSIDGDRAEVSVSAEGGNLGSGSLELVVVEEDGWRLDQLVGLEVDAKAYFQAQRTELEADSSVSAPGKKLIECSLDWAEKHVSASDLERATIAGDGYGYLSESYESCADEFDAAIFSPSYISEESGMPEAQAACFLSAFEASMSERDRKLFFAAIVGREEFPPELDAKRDEAAALCMGGAGSSSAAAA